MRDYRELNAAGQIARLRPLAWQAARAFGIEPDDVRIVLHSFNTTFRVFTRDGRSFALRLNTGSGRSVAAIQAEVEWVSALAADGIIGVAEPQATPDGDRVVAVNGPLGEVRCVMSTWLPGTLASKRPDPSITFQLGSVTRLLHEQASRWQIPAGAEFHPLPNTLWGFDWQFTPSPLSRRVFDSAEKALQRVQSGRRIPIHFDLHLHNVLVHQGALFIIDFDDCLCSAPILDSSVTVFALRHQENAEELEAAYWRGLGEDPDALEISRHEFEMLVAGRALLMANEFFRMSSAGAQNMKLNYRDLTEARLRRFEETGIFDPRMPLQQ